MYTSADPSSFPSRLRSAHSSTHAPTPPSSPRESSETETNKRTSSLGETIVAINIGTARGFVTDNLIDDCILHEGKVHHVESLPVQVSEFPCKIYHDLHEECVRKSSQIIHDNCSTALYNYNECLHQQYI